MVKEIIKIKGMHCSSCEKLITNELKDRVNLISVSSSNGIAEIDFNENKITKKEIEKIIKNCGFKVKGGLFNF